VYEGFENFERAYAGRKVFFSSRPTSAHGNSSAFAHCLQGHPWQSSCARSTITSTI